MENFKLPPLDCQKTITAKSAYDFLNAIPEERFVRNTYYTYSFLSSDEDRKNLKCCAVGWLMQACNTDNALPIYKKARFDVSELVNANDSAKRVTIFGFTLKKENPKKKALKYLKKYL
jgi:hypothetical protein